MAVVDMQKALSLIDSIPLVQESVPELTKLANGSNPEIPGFLALGKLQQLQGMISGSQDHKPPQGTIKDKLTQTGGLMALMAGAARKLPKHHKPAQCSSRAGCQKTHPSLKCRVKPCPTTQ